MPQTTEAKPPKPEGEHEHAFLDAVAKIVE
jgi:hypothetical protein